MVLWMQLIEKLTETGPLIQPTGKARKSGRVYNVALMRPYYIRDCPSYLEMQRLHGVGMGG